MLQTVLFLQKVSAGAWKFLRVFKRKGFPLYPICSQLYDGNLATGVHAASPLDAALDSSDDESDTAPAELWTENPDAGGAEDDDADSAGQRDESERIGILIFSFLF